MLPLIVTIAFIAFTIGLLVGYCIAINYAHKRYRQLLDDVHAYFGEHDFDPPPRRRN